MNYNLINGVEHIENIFNIHGERKEDEKIVRGYKIMQLDKCYQMLSRIKAELAWEVSLLEKWSDYLVKKDIPFAVTKICSENIYYFKMYVYGTEVVKEKSESKKIAAGS